ncbi:MAG: phosphoribosylamine--glycine ligase [Ruminococcaceae bacterium]|nr:phosphoribosylamine--glycine ligase [Oscillospiraceae bacterium]
MNILVVGGGGREHAVIKKLMESPKAGKIYAAPGNGGIALDGAECFPVRATDIEGMVALAEKLQPDLICVTPDDPLVLGMADVLEEKGFKVFGPYKSAAIIEGSKMFSKNLMKKYGIPTAEFEVFNDYNKAVEYVKEKGAPIVVKADGLALGKGVVVAQTVEEAIEALDSIMLDKKFGASGSNVVIEECLFGREMSVLAFTDGKVVKPMVSAQDHKRVFDNDKGPNTGGMGTYAPSPIYTPEVADYCMKNIFLPTVNAMNSEGRTFKGVLYFGLMKTEKGVKVIEYNARFGDPETQVVLPLLESDLIDIMIACADGTLENVDIKWADKAAVCVVMASGGYPGSYGSGFEITGLENAAGTVYHAGTKLVDGKIVTAGGRVLGVTNVGKDLADARDKSYKDVEKISFQGAFCRKDIAKNV